MRRTSRWLKIGFYSLVVGLLLGGVVAAFLYFQRGPAHHLQTGESSYQAGMSAVQGDQFDNAMVRFQEALLSCENALKELEESQESLPREQLEKQQRLMGQAFWLKYRALKARGFTRLLVEQKPLPTFEGQAEGTRDVVLAKLSVLRLPDDQMLREALTCLREAAYRLPGQAEVLREVVGVEVQIEPLQWNHIQAFATTLEKLDANDERGEYLLARLEYEQPIVATSTNGSTIMPLSPAKRSRDRMLKGLNRIAHLKELEQPIRWRTLYLEAQLHAWLVQYYHQPGQRKLDAEQSELAKLRALLFDQEPNVLTRAAQDEGVGKLSKLDLQGVYGLHQMALELTLEEGRQAQKSKQREVETPAESTLEKPGLERLSKVLDACIELASKTRTEGRAGQAADFLVQALLKAMPAIIRSRPAVWGSYRQQALELAEAANNEKTLEPLCCLRIADLLTKESQWLQSQKNNQDAEKKRQDAEVWLNRGLENGNKNRQSVDVTLALHEAELRLLLDRDAGRDSLQPHLDALRSSKNDSYVAVTAYYEGVLAEREGKLEVSRRLLEQALLAGRSDLNRRVLSRLVPLYLTLHLPEKSLAALTELERRSARLENLNEEEKNWYYTFVRSPEILAAFKIQAHLEAARLRQSQGEKNDQAQVAHHEQQAKQLVASLPIKSKVAAQARLQWAQYLFDRERIDEADQQLALLKRDHADLIEVMQVEVDRLVLLAEKGKRDGAQMSGPLPPETIVQADNIIQNYMKRPNANPATRLAWLTWLTNTGRAAEARTVLADPTFFADAATNPQVQKIKVLAELYYGNKPDAKSILSSLPHDPQIDIALLQAVATASEQQDILNGALQQQRDVGLFKAWSAALALGRGDHVQACQGFLGCLEYTRAKPLVRQGLTQALISLAQSNPQEARKLATNGLQKNPSELSLLLGYAYASLQLGEIGNPADAGDQVKDMASALRAYDAACQIERTDPSLGPWMATQFWLLAQRPDIARQEIAHVLERNPKHEQALVMGIKLAMDSADPEALQPAQKMAAAYQQLKPDASEGKYWQGQILQRVNKKNEALACYRDLLAQQPKYSPAYAASVDLLLSSTAPEAKTLCKEMLQSWHQALPEDLLAWQEEIRYQALQGNVNEAKQILEQRLSAIENKAAAKQPIQTVNFPSEQQKQQQLNRTVTTDLLVQGLMKVNQWEEAANWLQRALETSPDHEPTLLLLSEVYTQQMLQLPEGSPARKKLAGQAVDIYLQVYKRQKGHPLVGNNLAWLQVMELDDAAEAYRIAQEVRLGKFLTKPMAGEQLSADFLDTLGLIYEKLASADQTAERVALFESARLRYGQDPRIALHLGHAYSASKETKKAQQAYLSARTLLDKSQMLSPQRKQSLQMEIERGQARLKQLVDNPVPG